MTYRRMQATERRRTEEADKEPDLRRTSELASFVAGAPGAVAMFDRNMVCLAASNQWLMDFQLVESPVGQSHYRVFPEIPESWKAVHNRCLGGATERIEAVAFARADGRIQWVHWEGRPWRDDSGNIGGIVIAAEDVTARKQAEASADHLAAIVASSHDTIISTDLDSVVTAWNGGATRLLGYEADEIVGKPISLIVPPEHVAEDVGGVTHLNLDAGVALRETTRITRDGRVLEVELTISPIRNSFGTIYGVSHVMRDIGARKRAELALRESEAALRQSQHRLRLAADAGHLTYAEFDVDAGQTHAAENFVQVMGYQPLSTSGAANTNPALFRLLEHVAEDDRHRIVEAVQGFFAGSPKKRIEYRVIGDDGIERWIASFFHTELGQNGRPARVTVTCLDITPQVEARKEIEAAKGDANELLASIADGFYALDGEWRFVYFNARAEAMLGRTSATVVGRRFLDVFPQLDGTAIQANFQRVVAERRPLDFEAFGPVLMRWVAFSAYPTGEGGLSVFFRDIGAQKQAETELVAAKAEAERANRTKSKFLAAASHDLRQPVQSLELLLAVVERQVGAYPEILATVCNLKQALGGLNRLLASILDISILDAGVVEANAEGVDIHGLLLRLTTEYAPKAASRGLAFRSVKTSLHAVADPPLLERALRNLIENGLRYTSKGSILVGARRRGDRVRIDVVDTGIGVATEQQADIFGEFHQLANPGRDLDRGLGLGLAIVARLAPLLGATIDVASNVGRGSRFSLSLALSKPSPPVDQEDARALDAGGRLLVVEDNSILRDGLEIMLRQWGYEPVTASSGEEALSVGEREGWRFRGVVSDHRLGGPLTGLDTVRAIARRIGRDIPAVILTGDTAREVIGEIAASGIGMLHKPISAERLRSMLAQALGG